MSNRYIGGVVTETTNVAQSPWSGSWTEQAAMQGFGSVLKITNSLRFRASASAYLNRTPSSASNRQTWTWSGWVKRGGLYTTNEGPLLFSAGPDGANFTSIGFASNANDALRFVTVVNNSTIVASLLTTAVFRDPSAWYHIVIAMDTTQATSANRIKIYVNGIQLTSFSTSTYPAQNDAQGFVNAVTPQYVGRSPETGYRYFDGYLAEINFIDGQALDPTAFGAINKETGVWAPIAYAGTYGLNGFHLDFKNATSTTTLGYDTSGNGNNWTTNNISLTAGSTYDWMIDSPSKIQGTGYGVGNYCVINPLKNGGLTITNGNLSAVLNSGSNYTAFASIGVTSGKWYWEATATASTNIVGVANSSATIASYLGSDANGWGYYSNGTKINSGSQVAYGASYTTNDVIGIAFDADAGSLTFYKNNSSQGTAFTGLTSGPYFPALGNNVFGADFNFGQRPFAYTPPTGYKTLCTQNLPVATIYNGAQYMAATLWTGDGNYPRTITNTVNSVSLQPDFVWIKSRSNTYDHVLWDVIRGTGNLTSLNSNTAAAEGAYYGNANLTSFNTNGFSIGTTSGTNVLNASGVTNVAWQWKAGGTAVTNTAGTITSSVSANTTAGFSVVTYTGNGVSNATVGHGLGIAPSMVIVKRRNSTRDWCVWNASVYSAYGASYLLFLNTTGAAYSNSTVFNGNTTATTFPVVTNEAVNESGGTYVAYCFAAIAGYSAFGSYTGNGSADGPFVYCGFRPRYVLIKRTDSTGQWAINDSSRNPYNVTGLELFADLSDAESNDSPVYDFLSNGFKIRNSYASRNASGGTYIYAAFAENPFSVALAR